jgi:chromosome segregation ATPase
MRSHPIRDRARTIALVALMAAATPLQAQDIASREREALRRARAELRTAQDEAQRQQQLAAQSEADKARLSRERDGVSREARLLRQQLAAAVDKAVALEAETARLKAEAADRQRVADDAARESSRRHNDAERQLAALAAEIVERKSTIAGLSAALERSIQALAQVEAANRELYRVAQRAIDRYHGKTTLEAAKLADPVLGLAAVSAENESESLRIEAEKSRLGR